MTFLFQLSYWLNGRCGRRCRDSGILCQSTRGHSGEHRAVVGSAGWRVFWPEALRP